MNKERSPIERDEPYTSCTMLSAIQVVLKSVFCKQHEITRCFFLLSPRKRTKTSFRKENLTLFRSTTLLTATTSKWGFFFSISLLTFTIWYYARYKSNSECCQQLSGSSRILFINSPWVFGICLVATLLLSLIEWTGCNKQKLIFLYFSFPLWMGTFVNHDNLFKVWSGLRISTKEPWHIFFIQNLQSTFSAL